jgi:hypothetical protein
MSRMDLVKARIKPAIFAGITTLAIIIPILYIGAIFDFPDPSMPGNEKWEYIYASGGITIMLLCFRKFGLF